MRSILRSVVVIGSSRTAESSLHCWVFGKEKNSYQCLAPRSGSCHVVKGTWKWIKWREGSFYWSFCPSIRAVTPDQFSVHRRYNKKTYIELVRRSHSFNDQFSLPWFHYSGLKVNSLWCYYFYTAYIGLAAGLVFGLRLGSFPLVGSLVYWVANAPYRSHSLVVALMPGC